MGCCLGPYVNNKFPVGWCTYYVATKRNISWSGDAGYWYANASAQGYPVGPTPKVGAIMVTWESWAGHVAYVEAVNPDGSWMVTEMNWVAFNVIDERTIKPGQLGQKLVGGSGPPLLLHRLRVASDDAQSGRRHQGGQDQQRWRRDQKRDLQAADPVRDETDVKSRVRVSEDMRDEKKQGHRACPQARGYHVL